MAVFTEEKRLFKVLLASCALCGFYNVFYVGIHFRYYVIPDSLCADSALIVYGYFRTYRFQKFIAFVLAFVSAGFIAERPHRD